MLYDLFVCVFQELGREYLILKSNAVWGTGEGKNSLFFVCSKIFNVS